MELIINPPERDKTNKPELEQLERQKKEYQFLGQVLRTRGLNMYCWNTVTGHLVQVPINWDKTLELGVTPDRKKFTGTKAKNGKVMANSSHIYFEALNDKSAEKRVRKYLAGKIRFLSNLRAPGGREKIKPY